MTVITHHSEEIKVQFVKGISTSKLREIFDVTIATSSKLRCKGAREETFSNGCTA